MFTEPALHAKCFVHIISFNAQQEEVFINLSEQIVKEFREVK